MLCCILLYYLFTIRRKARLQDDNQPLSVSLSSSSLARKNLNPFSKNEQEVRCLDPLRAMVIPFTKDFSLEFGPSGQLSFHEVHT